MHLIISTEHNNEGARYQENIVTWNDTPGELFINNNYISATQNSSISPFEVATLNTNPATTAENQGKIWLWEDNNFLYVSFINQLDRSHIMLIQMKLFNLKHPSGILAEVLYN